MKQSNSTTNRKTPHHKWAYFNGEFVESALGVLPITTQAFNYGTGVFEGIRCYKDFQNNFLNVFRLDEHLDRLLQSALVLKINDLPSHQAIKNLVLELLKRNNVEGDCYIRPIVFKQNLLPGATFGVKLSGVSTGLSINSLNMNSYTQDKGISCAISRWRRIADTAIPARAKITGGYVNSALAMETAHQAGYDDAIMLNNDGYISESTTSNVFIVRNGKLITPPVTAHILEGITRDSVIKIANKFLKLEVCERDILPSELLTAEECFLTGTGVEVSLVSQIDYHQLRSAEKGSTSLKIKETYAEVVRGKLTDFAHWLTPISIEKNSL